MCSYIELHHPSVAEFFGYRRYDEFRIEDESTYTRLCEDAYRYFIENPAAEYYRCWVPQFKAIHVHREALDGIYAVA